MTPLTVLFWEANVRRRLQFAVCNLLGCVIIMASVSSSTRLFYCLLFVILAVLATQYQCNGFQLQNVSSIRKILKASTFQDEMSSGETTTTTNDCSHHRREFLRSILVSSASLLVFGCPRNAFSSGADTVADSLDVQDFLRRGVAVNPMGVSGQAGKSRPVTGVILR